MPAWLTLRGCVASIWFAGLLLFPALDISASEPLHLGRDSTSISLSRYAEVFADRTRLLSLDEVKRKGFLPFANFGDKALSHTSVWVRLVIHNEEAPSADWILLITTDIVDRVELYANGKRVDSGRFVPFGLRPVVYRHFAMPLELAQGATQTVYIHLDSDASIFLPMQLWEKSAFQTRDRHEQLLFGLYFGLAGVMLLYNLFLALSLRSMSYAYYVGYVLCFALYQTTLNGISLEFFWPDHPVWNTRFSFLSANLAILMSLVFTRRFLNLSSISRSLNWGILTLMGASIIATAASQLLDHRQSDVISRAVGTAAALAVSVSGLTAWLSGYSPARFFFTAWFLFILGALLFTLMGLGVLPRNDYTRYSMQIGSAAEMILLSLALSDRITILRRERDAAAAVARSIEREMQTARTIQKAILPEHLPSTTHAVFAARYRPAASVGGDFYDFHQISPDKVGVLIADVTGHGVPAALVASMLKVSFAHQRHIISKPDLVLETMNRELAVRFGRHFITAGCLWLDIGAGLAVYGSAGHLPICLRHRSTKKTEEIISYGKLLGWPDLFNVKPVTVRIQSADRLLVYTDGLIESRNAKGELFGFARLYELLARLDDEPVERAADMVLESVTQWVGRGDDFEDDMTLVLIDIT